MTEREKKDWFMRGVFATYWNQPYGDREIYTGFFGGYKSFNMAILDLTDSEEVRRLAEDWFRRELKTTRAKKVGKNGEV